MRFKQFIHNGKIYTNESQINNILKQQELYWLIDSEIENAIVEVTNNTVIWHDGIFYTGFWHYGVFKKGIFYGIWENGIWENGNFKGRWISGVR
jgi:hypothetical protein